MQRYIWIHNVPGNFDLDAMNIMNVTTILVKEEFINCIEGRPSYWLLHAWTNSAMLIIFLTKGRIKGGLILGTTFDLLGTQITSGKKYLSKTVDFNHKGLK